MFVPSERLQYTISAKFRQDLFSQKFVLVQGCVWAQALRPNAPLNQIVLFILPLHAQQFNQPEYDEQEDGQADKGNDGV